MKMAKRMPPIFRMKLLQAMMNGDAIAHSAAPERSRKPNLVRYMALIKGQYCVWSCTGSDEALKY
jgi:hypothetical protein